jgi:hypothetical protein
MATLTTVTPGVTSVAPNFTAVTAADKFLSGGGGGWRIHYRNGGTIGTLALYVTNNNVTVPPGAAAPALPTGATNWSDDLVINAMAASSDRVLYIPAIYIAQFTDSTGFVNLKHNGTITTITVSVEGPF